MSEAKPQDGSTVKGYRTLTAGDIERMNRLKGVSRHFCSLLDTDRGELLADHAGSGDLSEQRAVHTRRRCIRRQNCNVCECGQPRDYGCHECFNHHIYYRACHVSGWFGGGQRRR
ncbi:hypothetical protein FMK70_23015 [Klebsiella michiganensis]|uniref:hypothetical protein n=1 Tax=Klebsiella michiganensis TaxID=1134687 RepID=UPI001CCE70CC|nr:hypothetical protein [Klebsiella michiganensis]MBZ7269963.1 hypothetical protein [Klebsiella michiganensis]